MLKNALIVNEGKTFKGQVLTEDGKIQAIFRQGQEQVFSDHIRQIDLEGMYLLPGIIDDHVHFREPGLTHKGDIASESRAAVAGGITSYMEMPNTVPQTTSQQALEQKFHLASLNSLANYSFYLGATNENHDAIKATDPGHVCGIKVFMGSSTGNMLVDNPMALGQIFRESRLPIVVHCEDEATIQANLQKAIGRFGQDIPPDQHPVIRDHQACFLSSNMAVDLARKHDTRLHLLHLTTAQETLLLESQLPLHQKLITGEVCVHHLWFSDQDYASKGNLVKWNPAIKTEDDRAALRDALKLGMIDVVATDHAPHTLQEKQNTYLSCPSGGPMIQHSLPVMLELVHQGIFTMEQLVGFMCHNPAISFGVKDRGFIRKGYAADLVAVDAGQVQKVEKQNILYKCGWSPLEGSSLHGAVQYTIVNGNLVYEKGTFHQGIKGMALEFSR